MLRSQIREEIFKILFRYPFMEESEMQEQIAFCMENLEGKSEENLAYIRNKVNQIIEHREAIDGKIQDNCEGWNLNRVGKAEIAIMRVAVYELLYEKEIPMSVSINEAVELAKSYCDEDAKGFVNAVLGKVAKNLEK
ncbi:MAG: transcription antitermination factor NusB [Clostridium sp.]|nr:transcription antitermination factor NusB [Clostridium sp.]